MYTSFYGQSFPNSRRNKNQNQAPPTAEELQEGIDNAPALQLTQKILDGKATVKQILTDVSFIVYHEAFRQEFLVRKLPPEEKIDTWIDLQTHSNVVTAFDQFTEPGSNHKFSMVEKANGGNMYQLIQSKNLDLAVKVPSDYHEFIYDVAIQLATGLDFAHNAGLVHGQFDLSKVVVQKDGDNYTYQITDFAPHTSMQMPFSTEANYWPFSRNKKQISDREKLEVLMLKDIYSLGICILEMMIGRFSQKKFSISLDSLPLTWAEYAASTPLIQVLVECIQIDSITSRKGKLQKIRKLLIHEYKKFFQHSFYKMENPFVGKKADVYNKKGIVALFHNKEEEALRCWSEARMLNDRHFDSHCNFVMHRWSTARISDAQLMAELDQFVFSVGGKGQCLEASLNIAIGERNKGTEILKQYIDETKKNLKSQRGRLVNQKVMRQLESAEKVYNAIQLEKETFFQNFNFPHNHSEKIESLVFSQNSNFLLSVCKQTTKVWKVAGSSVSLLHSIPNNEHGTEGAKCKPLACIDNKGELVVVYRGNFFFTVYEFQNGNAVVRDVINLTKEIRACGNPGFELEAYDQVSEIRFLAAESTHLRVCYSKGMDHYFIDVQLYDCVPQMRRAVKFEDKSVFQLTTTGQANAKQLQQQLTECVNEAQTKGNLVAFPDKDVNTCAVLNREDRSNKHILLFDIRRNGFVRKIPKKHMDDEAFCLNESGRLLVFAEDDQIVFKLVRLPNSAILIDTLRPRYARAEANLNPAQASENKQLYKQNIEGDLRFYTENKLDPEKAEKKWGVTDEQNIHLMVMRYSEACLHKYKLKANRYFMTMQKILLRDAGLRNQPKDLLAKCPLNGIDGLKRIEVYDDELTYVSRDSKIDLCQISSEVHRNFFLIAMDGTVFKYDLVSKELLFQFKTNATKSILLYDKDDKLVVASEEQVRLWDFYDHKEEAPELITAMDSTLKVEQIYVNKNCKGPLYVVVVCQDEFIVYSGRLERKFGAKLEEDGARITSGEFNSESSTFFVGTSTGKILTYNLSSGKQEGNEFVAAGSLQSITMLKRFVGIEELSVFLYTVDNNELFIFNDKKKTTKKVEYGTDGDAYEGHEICNVHIAINNKFFVLGVPEKRAFGVFSFDDLQHTAKCLKWFTKYSFLNFFADDHLSCVMFLDQNRKTLDYNFLLWKFDMSKLDLKALEKLDKADKEDISSTESEQEDDDDSLPKTGVEKVVGSSCCTIF